MHMTTENFGGSVCTNHLTAYRQGVWRWIPTANLRKEMKNTTEPLSCYGNDIMGKVNCHFLSPYLVTNNVYKLPEFDLLVFLPDHFPDFKTFMTALQDEYGAEDSCDSSQRVLKVHKKVLLDPYLVVCAALPMIGAAYMPPPDSALRDVEEDCMRMRKLWNTKDGNQRTVSTYFKSLYD